MEDNQSVTVTKKRDLTRREREVADLIAIGHTGTDIAKILGFSVKTYDTHRGKIMKKLNLRHNVDLARYAIKVGWVQV